MSKTTNKEVKNKEVVSETEKKCLICEAMNKKDDVFCVDCGHTLIYEGEP